MFGGVLQQWYVQWFLIIMVTLRDALVTVDSLTIVVAVLKRAMMLNLPIVLTLTDFLRTVLTDSAMMMMMM